MKIIKGFFSWHSLVKFHKPKKFSIYLGPLQSKFEIWNNAGYWDFKLISGAKKPESILHAFSLAIGFTFGFSFYESYGMPPEAHKGKYAYSRRKSAEPLNFEFSRRIWKFDTKRGRHVEATESHKETIHIKEITDLTRKILASKVLSSAAAVYLNSFEDPEFFLYQLYRAYETVKNSFPNSKKFVDELHLSEQRLRKFKCIANDPEIYIARHAGKPTDKQRGLTYKEHQFCDGVIREIINSYSNYQS